MMDDPRDQADGFHESPEDRAKREAMGASDAAWRLIFELDRLSETRQWDKMRAALDAHAGDVPFHDFSETAFRRAAAAGQLDVVERMAAKNFVLPPENGADLVADLAEHSLPQAEKVIRYLLENGTPADQAVLAAAEHGRPEMMDALKNMGCDIQRGGEAFSSSLQAGNLGMMQYLCRHGADLYTPGVAAGLFGGIEDHARHDPPGASARPDDTRRLFARLLGADAYNWTRYYVAVAGGTRLDDFRDIPYGVRAERMTAMHVAARAGCIGDVIDAALKETDNPLTAKDLLTPDAKGASVLSILAVRGEAAALFDPRLWWRRPEEAGKLHAALEAMGGKDLVDAAALAADIQRLRLKTLAKGAIRLPRKP